MVHHSPFTIISDHAYIYSVYSPLKEEKKVGTSSTCEEGPLPILAAA
jgi:hypothetical protein